MKTRTTYWSWLSPATGLLSGAALAVGLYGFRSEQQQQLLPRLEEFQALAAADQHLVRQSYRHFEGLSATRRGDLVTLHEATQKSPELSQALDRYYQWWSGLSQAEWDAFEEMNHESRVAWVRSHWNESPRNQEQLTIRFQGPVQGRLPDLHLTLPEYWKFVSAIRPMMPTRPEVETEINRLEDERHRALRLTLWYFEYLESQIRAQRDPLQDTEAGSGLHKAVGDSISDEAWKRQFRRMYLDGRGRPFARAWLTMTLFTILEQAAESLGNDLLADFPVTPEQIIEAFDSMSDRDRQLDLMTMSAADARQRLELQAQIQRPASPERDLLVLFAEFSRRRHELRSMPFDRRPQPPARAPE